jgi:hypothetical protein
LYRHYYDTQGEGGDIMSDIKEHYVLDRDSLPEALSPQHIQDILGLGRRTTYELMNSENPPFKVLKVGRVFKVSKKNFLEWFDGEYPKQKPGRKPSQPREDNDVEYMAKVLIEFVKQYEERNRWWKL